MSLVYCITAGTLVEPELWLPGEPFDYVWGRFGCNQLRCGSCGQSVRSHVEKYCRHYECACQSRDEYSFHLLGSDAGRDREFVTAWHCAGHPQLQLPTQLDGIELAAVGPFATIVSQTLANPPFVAPGFRSSSFWVQRLYRLLPAAAQQESVGQAVAAQLSSTDARTARAAMDFFYEMPWASGAEQIATVAYRERDRLRATPDPTSPASSLYDRILETVEERLIIQDAGVPVDQAALDLARRALLAGEAGSGMVFRVASRDASWFCDHAADIVRARPQETEFVLEALTDMPAASRALVLQSVQSIGKAASRAVSSWLKEHPELFDRS